MELRPIDAETALRPQAGYAQALAVEGAQVMLAAPRVVSCTEGARVQPDGPRRAAHDALNRLLHRLEPDMRPLRLWLHAGVSDRHPRRRHGILGDE